MIKELILTSLTAMMALNGRSYDTRFSSYFDNCSDGYVLPSYVYTPNNTQVDTLDRTNDDIDYWQMLTLNNQIAADYPNAIFLDNATNKYNCHSYAWYMQNSQYNLHWMNSPSQYVLDFSYSQVIVSPQVGDIICYINSNGQKIHSGRITQVFAGSSNGVCGSSNLYQVTSKWGGYGLYSHRGDQCPYTSYGGATGNGLAVMVLFYRLNSSHVHSWNFYPHNNYQHYGYCSCSQVIFENHNWISISKDEGEKGLPTYLCLVCGKTSVYPY